MPRTTYSLAPTLPQRDFTRTGKRGILGVLKDGGNSVKRFYLNNFKDNFRQGAFDAIMCKDLSAYVDESDTKAGRAAACPRLLIPLQDEGTEERIDLARSMVDICETHLAAEHEKIIGAWPMVRVDLFAFGCMVTPADPSSATA